MKKLMTWSLIVASFGLTGCKSLQDYMDDMNNKDEKELSEVKSDPSHKASERSRYDRKIKPVSTTTTEPLKSVGYGYSSSKGESKVEAPVDAPESPVIGPNGKKPVEEKTEVAPVSQMKNYSIKSFRKVSDDAPSTEAAKAQAAKDAAAKQAALDEAESDSEE